jgi:hypothetical protein
MGTNQWGGVGAYRLQDERTTNIPMSFPMTRMGFPAVLSFLNTAILAATDTTWCTTNSRGLNCGAYTWLSQYDGGGFEAFIRIHDDWTPTPVRLYWQGSYFASGTPLHTCWAWVTQLQSTTINNDSAYPCVKATVSTNSPAWQGFYETTWAEYPDRYWYYDTTFDNVDTQPVLTPRVVMLKEVYFTEQFQ